MHRVRDLAPLVAHRGASDEYPEKRSPSDTALPGAAAIGCDLVTPNRPHRLVALHGRGTLNRAR